MIPTGIPIEKLLQATEIYGVLTRCEDQITVDHRDKLLTELEKELIPDLINYQNYPPVRKILEEYNRNIPKNLHEQKPIHLD